MHFNITGTGTPILLIHGFCEDSSIWEELEKVLSKDYKVISIDLPGFGKSPLLIKEETLDGIAEEIHDFLLELRISKCFMIGHSLGGYIILSFAKSYPEMLLGFGLFHSTTFADSEEKKKTRAKGIEHVKTNGMISFAKGFVPNLFYEGNHAKCRNEIEALKKTASYTSTATFVTYSRAMKDRKDSTAMFSEFVKPIFVIAGENDRAVPVEQSKEMATHINNGEALILPRTGHMGFIEQKKQSIEFITSFLKKVSL